jgi:predicted RNase H-like HicB family nuclease
MRMSMRPFTRPTNAFSTKAENHGHQLAIFFMRYHLGADLSDLVGHGRHGRRSCQSRRSMEEIAGMIETAESKPSKRCPYMAKIQTDPLAARTRIFRRVRACYTLDQSNLSIGAMTSADLTFTAVFEISDEGGYVVSFPAIPDLVTQGETLEEARAMAADCLQGYLESLAERGLPIPRSQPTDTN